jgi:hypothetical protein
MNKKYLFITSLLPIFLVFWLYYFYNQSKKTDDIVKDTLIKNLNWDSPLQQQVPYVTGNEIELYYILDYKSGNDISIDLTLLQEEFNISEILIWDKKLEIEDILSFSIQDNTPLKITWIAKNNSNISDQNLRNLIKIKSSVITQNKDKIIEEEIWNPQNIDGTEVENTTITAIEVIPEEVNNNDFSQLKFNNISFNSNINNLLEITWKNYDKIKFLNIWSYSFTPTFKDETAYFLINKNTFDSGNYFVFIQPIEWKIVPLNTQIQFSFISSDINIANITPQTVNNTKDSYIVLQWNGFNDIISLQLNNNIILKNTSFEVINDKVLSVKISKDLEPGTYHFNIMTTNNIINLDTMNFTIIQ